MKFGVYDLGTEIIITSNKKSHGNYNKKTGIVLNVTKNGWHTVLVEGSTVKLRTTELKKKEKSNRKNKYKSPRTYRKNKPKNKSKDSIHKSTRRSRRSMKKHKRSKPKPIQKSRPIEKSKPIPIYETRPTHKRSKRSKRSRRSKRRNPSIPERPVLQQKKLPFLQDINQSKTRLKNFKKPFPLEKQTAFKIETPKSSISSNSKNYDNAKSKRKKRKSFTQTVYKIYKDAKQKRINSKLKSRKRKEEKRVKKAKENYTKERKVYERNIEIEEQKRGRPTLNIEEKQFYPKSITYFFEDTQYYAQGNKNIKNMFISDSRFYGNTYDGIVVDAELSKVSDYVLDKKGNSTLFYWSEGINNYKLTFNFDNEKDGEEFYYYIFYEVYPNYEFQENEYYV